MMLLLIQTREQHHDTKCLQIAGTCFPVLGCSTHTFVSLWRMALGNTEAERQYTLQGSRADSRCQPLKSMSRRPRSLLEFPDIAPSIPCLNSLTLRPQDSSSSFSYAR